MRATAINIGRENNVCVLTSDQVGRRGKNTQPHTNHDGEEFGSALNVKIETPFL